MFFPYSSLTSSHKTCCTPAIPACSLLLKHLGALAPTAPSALLQIATGLTSSPPTGLCSNVISQWNLPSRLSSKLSPHPEAPYLLPCIYFPSVSNTIYFTIIFLYFLLSFIFLLPSLPWKFKFPEGGAFVLFVHQCNNWYNDNSTWLIGTQ